MPFLPPNQQRQSTEGPVHTHTSIISPQLYTASHTHTVHTPPARCRPMATLLPYALYTHTHTTVLLRLCFLTVLFASASEATATRRFTNFVLYCINAMNPAFTVLFVYFSQQSTTTDKDTAKYPEMWRIISENQSNLLRSITYQHFSHRCMTELSCLQCFDTVGWVAGRASGM